MRIGRRHAGVLAVVALALAYAWPMQGVGWNQNSHYALTKALAGGTAVVDRTRHELGDLGTGDVTRWRGHVYSNKAPALAALSVPVYVSLKAAGARTVGDPTRMLWALGLVGAVLPAIGAVLLVRRVSDRLEPGFGTLAGVTLGLGTMLLPYATLFYAHALSAFLVFAAFAVLFVERHGAPRLPLVAAAGLLAGFAVTTEYPCAFAAGVLGVYALCRADWPVRALVYTASIVVGLVPLALYNRWAFGSITHLSYVGDAGEGLRHAPSPSFRPVILLETLFGRTGLLTLAPVLACAVVGIVLLYRRGWRAEVLAIAGIAVLYAVYNASYGSNFGGFAPGQRYLIPILPLLALGLAPAFRSFPVTTGALALVSAIVTVSITATHALAGYDSEWLGRVRDLEFTPTAASLIEVTGWYTIVPFVAAAAAAAVLAVLATPRVDPSIRDVLAAPGAVLGWALVASTAPALPQLGGRGEELSAYVWVLAIALAAALAVAAVRYRPSAAS